MPERWEYNFVFLIQRGQGVVGFSARPVTLDHRIDSFEIVEMIVSSIETDLFPDGPPDLPEGVMPVVPITWQLVRGRSGPGVPDLSEPTAPEGGSGGAPAPDRPG